MHRKSTIHIHRTQTLHGSSIYPVSLTSLYYAFLASFPLSRILNSHPLGVPYVILYFRLLMDIFMAGPERALSCTPAPALVFLLCFHHGTPCSPTSKKSAVANSRSAMHGFAKKTEDSCVAVTHWACMHVPRALRPGMVQETWTLTCNFQLKVDQAPHWGGA